jgi:hypothetical protein
LVDFTALEGDVAKRLKAANIPFVRQADVSGAIADFWVPTETGRGVAIEVKSGKPRPDQVTRLTEVVKRLNDRSRDVEWIHVLKDPVVPKRSNFIIGTQDLIGKLKENQPLNIDAWNPSRSSVKPAGRALFASIPFDSPFLDTYEAMRKAAVRVRASCRRMDEPEYSGPDVPFLVRNRIRETVLTLCDLSLAKQNVLYELGFSDGLGHPAILICSTPREGLPTLVRSRNTIPYSMGQTVKLVEPLVKALKANFEPAKTS